LHEPAIQQRRKEATSVAVFKAVKATTEEIRHEAIQDGISELIQYAA